RRGVAESHRRNALRFHRRVCTLQGNHGSIILSEVLTCTSHHDSQFDGCFSVYLSSLIATTKFDCLFRTTQPALTVGHNSYHAWTTGDSASSTQFRERLFPFSGVVGSNAIDLTSNSYTASTVLSSTCVAQG